MQLSRNKTAKKQDSSINTPAFGSPDNACTVSMATAKPITTPNPSTPSALCKTQDSRKKAPTLVTQAAINDINSTSNSVPDTPIIPRKIHPNESTFTPKTQHLMSQLALKMKEKSPTTQDNILSKTKELHREHRPEILSSKYIPSSSKYIPSKQPVIDMEAFQYYRPAVKGGKLSSKCNGKKTSYPSFGKW